MKLKIQPLQTGLLISEIIAKISPANAHIIKDSIAQLMLLFAGLIYGK